MLDVKTCEQHHLAIRTTGEGEIYRDQLIARKLPSSILSHQDIAADREYEGTICFQAFRQYFILPEYESSTCRHSQWNRDVYLDMRPGRGAEQYRRQHRSLYFSRPGRRHKRQPRGKERGHETYG
jgi:hypothetical protein